MACDHLEQGRLKEALKALDRISDPDESIISDSIALTARGLLFEQRQEIVEADKCFAEVFSRGVPVPAVLREMGRYYKRRARYDRAFQCFALLRSFEDPDWVAPQFGAAMNPRTPRPGHDRARDAVTEFVDGLPPAELARHSPWIVREMINTVGLSSWYLPRLKQALASQLGPRGAALAFATMARKKEGWEVGEFRLTSLRDFARSSAVVYDELVASRTVEMPRPRVFRAPQPPSTEAETRTLFFAILKDVVVSSLSNVLIARDQALLDYQDDELKDYPIDLSVDPLIFAATDGSVTLLVDETADSAPQLEQAFSLVGLNSPAFGHLIFEFLPKVFACLDRPGFDSVPLLIDEGIPRQHREALELFVGRDHPIQVVKLGEAVRVKRLWTCSMPHYLPLAYDSAAPVDGEAFAKLVERACSRLELRRTRPGPQRLYLARRRALARKLVNPEEVEAWFSRRGFELVEFEDLSFSDQFELIRGADLIVGPEGSALSMGLFGRRDLRMGVLSNPYIDAFGAPELIIRSLGKHMLVLTGEVVRETPDLPKSDYRIDIEALPAFLSELESMAQGDIS